jgi:bla regulator protein BlaR1
MFIRYLIIWFIVVGFLPDNAKLIQPVKPESARAIQYRDLDGDGTEEIIATYKVIKELPEVNVMILKKKNGKWNMIQQLKSNGYAVDQVAFKDIDGDGIDEVLFGSKLGGTFNNINVYKAVNDKYSKVYNNIYTELQIDWD